MLYVFNDVGVSDLQPCELSRIRPDFKVLSVQAELLLNLSYGGTLRQVRLSVFDVFDVGYELYELRPSQQPSADSKCLPLQTFFLREQQHPLRRLPVQLLHLHQHLSLHRLRHRLRNDHQLKQPLLLPPRHLLQQRHLCLPGLRSQLRKLWD